MDPIVKTVTSETPDQAVAAHAPPPTGTPPTGTPPTGTPPTGTPPTRGPGVAIAGRSTGSSLIARPRVLNRLFESGSFPLVLLEAPAGYSKTTCLALWDEADRREFCWLSCQKRHDDPSVLLSAIMEALEPVQPINLDVLSALNAPLPDIATALHRLERSIRQIEEPFVIVIDDAHNLRHDDSFLVLESLLNELPQGSQMAIASRSHPGLSLGRLRAKRRLFELDAAELALTRRESAELLDRMGLGAEPDQVDRLFDRTEGWPAALYLGGIALQRTSGSLTGPTTPFSGDDELVVEYLRDEFFDGMPPDRARFLYRTSVLEDFSPPLCVAVTGREDSAVLLEELSRQNALVVPLDRAGRRFRYHHLFADMLRSELRRREPGTENGIHIRATHWYAEDGDLERAVGHAIESDDTDLAGELIWRALPEVISRGRIATLNRWVRDLGPGRIGSSTSPTLVLMMAHRGLASGKGSEAHHWASVAARLVGPGSPYEADAHILKATLGTGGTKAMQENAVRATRLLAPTNPWQASCCLYQGIALQLSGSPADADPLLRDAVRSGAVVSPLIQAIALAQRSQIAITAGEPDSASRLIAQARDQVERCGLDSYPVMAIVFSTSALVRARQGLTDAAAEDLAKGRRLPAQLDDYINWLEAETRLALCETSLRLGDLESAASMLSSASGSVKGFPHAPVLEEWFALLGDAIRESRGALQADGVKLTAAEVRVLQLLPSHLSFRDIGDQLHVSINTVKTQARSLYRKLGVSSRTEAVVKARDVGLLDAD